MKKEESEEIVKRLPLRLSELGLYVKKYEAKHDE